MALAKAGKRVPVTERGKLVAYLVPAEEATMTTFQDDDRLTAAAAAPGIKTASPA